MLVSRLLLVFLFPLLFGLMLARPKDVGEDFIEDVELMLARPTRHPEDVGGMDLGEVVIDVDPTEGKRNMGRSDQGVSVRKIENVVWPKNTWSRVGNKVLVYILKRSDADERQMDGRIRILKKRDNYNRDDMGINFKRILKKRDNMDGKIRILKK